MGGAEPAHTLVAAALAAGKSVVTANKHIVANYGPELERLRAHPERRSASRRRSGAGSRSSGPIAQDLAANRISGCAASSTGPPTTCSRP